jgi:excisionase family DNA binding protein
MCAMFTAMTDAATPGAADMLTVKQVADQLGLSPRQVYNLIDAGKITYHRYPDREGGEDGAIRVRQSEVERFLAATKVERVAA